MGFGFGFQDPQQAPTHNKLLQVGHQLFTKTSQEIFGAKLYIHWKPNIYHTSLSNLKKKKLGLPTQVQNSIHLWLHYSFLIYYLSPWKSFLLDTNRMHLPSILITVRLSGFSKYMTERSNVLPKQ